MSLLKDKKKRDVDLSAARDKKCEPVADAILQIIAKHKPSASITSDQKDHEKMTKAYTPIFVEIMELCLAKNLKLTEIGYTMSIVKLFVDFTDSIVGKSLNQNKAIAEEKVWGKDVSELTLQDLDDIMKKKK